MVCYGFVYPAVVKCHQPEASKSAWTKLVQKMLAVRNSQCISVSRAEVLLPPLD